ncbi:hypothetical protein LX36DRAFT_651055 [Colletotrichum falcatum]|nr:hypothetical protein LX36DRAFT_651055 [Colletotrichum falcatum]
MASPATLLAAAGYLKGGKPAPRLWSSSSHRHQNLVRGNALAPRRTSASRPTVITYTND